MSRRKVAVDSDDEDMETGQFIPKKTRSNQGMGKRMYEFRRLQDVERFVSKIYWLVILSFMGVGIAMVATLSERTFRDVFMAESLMSTLGITAYVILLLLLLMCHSHREMRIVLLLSLCVFIGAVSGFMTALHLLDISIVLKKAN
jgi:hypothetical protein